MSKKIAILCDFDGTVAGDDVGNLLFRTFADEREARSVVDEWKRGLISSRECLERECSLATLSQKDFDRFIRARKLDAYFKDFLDFTRRRGMEIVIVSDGLDYYIERMLLRNGAGDVEFFANQAELTDHTLQVAFPYYDLMDCKDCGNCKRHHLEKFRSAGYYVVYVGNGLSDRCPAEHADLVFAKGDLLTYCLEQEITYVKFNTFRDVEREMLRRFVINGSVSDEDGDR